VQTKREAVEGEEREIGPQKGGLGFPSLKCACPSRHHWLAICLSPGMYLSH